MKKYLWLIPLLFIANANALTVVFQINEETASAWGPPGQSVGVLVGGKIEEFEALDIFGEFEATFEGYVNPGIRQYVVDVNFPNLQAHTSLLFADPVSSCIMGKISGPFGGGGWAFGFWGLDTCKAAISTIGISPPANTLNGSKSVGSTHADKAAAITSILNTSFGNRNPPFTTQELCTGTCFFGNDTCMPTNLYTYESDWRSPLGTLPDSERSSIKLKFVDTNGNGVPDTYQWTDNGWRRPGQPPSPQITFSYRCNCEEPDSYDSNTD